MVTINYDYSAVCKNEVDVRIAQQEHKDTYIVANTLNDIFPNENITVTQKPQFFNYDLDVEIKDKQLAVEVKEYNLPKEKEEKYGKNVLLKVDKLMRMMRESAGKKLWYAIILNKKELYIFDCSKIDWASLKIIPLKQKACQFDPNSRYIYKDTYILPCKYALKPIPCDFNYWVYEELEDKPEFTIKSN